MSGNPVKNHGKNHEVLYKYEVRKYESMKCFIKLIFSMVNVG